MPTRIDIPREKLAHMIEVQKLRQEDAADILGISQDTVRARCREWGLKTSPRGTGPGPASASWKGGRRKTADGYWIVWRPEHPHATKNGMVREHRLVMEQMIGRYLRPEESVHHVDRDRGNNSPENLRLYSTAQEHSRDAHADQAEKWVQKRREGWQRYYDSLTPEQKAERHRKLHQARDQYYLGADDDEKDRRMIAIREGIAKSRQHQAAGDRPLPQTTTRPT